MHKKAREKQFDPKKIVFDKALILIIRGIALLLFEFFTREKFPK